MSPIEKPNLDYDQNFLIRSEMFRGHIEEAVAKSENTVGTAVRKVTEDPIIMTDIAREEIITQKTIEKSIKNLGEEDLETGPTVVTESIIVVIIKRDMTQAILKEIDVITKVVEGEVNLEIENTQGGKENPMFIPTSRKRLKPM